jgi:hypothetical protein
VKKVSKPLKKKIVKYAVYMLAVEMVSVCSVKSIFASPG